MKEPHREPFHLQASRPTPYTAMGRAAAIIASAASTLASSILKTDGSRQRRLVQGVQSSGPHGVQGLKRRAYLPRPSQLLGSSFVPHSILPFRGSAPGGYHLLGAVPSRLRRASSWCRLGNDLRMPPGGERGRIPSRPSAMSALGSTNLYLDLISPPIDRHPRRTSPASTYVGLSPRKSPLMKARRLLLLRRACEATAARSRQGQEVGPPCRRSGSTARHRLAWKTPDR